jgi:hypothetical protein
VKCPLALTDVALPPRCRTAEFFRFSPRDAPFARRRKIPGILGIHALDRLPGAMRGKNCRPRKGHRSAPIGRISCTTTATLLRVERPSSPSRISSTNTSRLRRSMRGGVAPCATPPRTRCRFDGVSSSDWQRSWVEPASACAVVLLRLRSVAPVSRH